MASGTQVGEASIALKFDTKSLNSSKKDVVLAATSTGESAGESFLKGFSTFTLANLASSGIQKVLGAITSQIDSAISRVDTMNNFPKVMQALGFSSEEASASVKKVSDRLDGLPTTMNGLISDIQKLTATMGNLNRGTVNATSLGLALNDMFLAGGKGVEAASLAMEQYNQMLAQGKPDMQSWRSILNAAPGQLKQLSKTLLGATANQNDLYEALKKGNVTFDQLNEAIVELDRNGGDGFASFEKQARSATGGIGTALDNVKNRISKAIATIIDTIGADNIANAINGISSQFASWGKSVAQFIKYIAENNAVLGAFKAVIISILGLGITSKVAALFALIAAHPVGAFVTAIIALGGALSGAASQESELVKAMKATKEESDRVAQSWSEAAKRRQDMLDKGMSELGYYESLQDELKKITDANGKVRDGYQKRAEFITGRLSEALGIEIKMQDGVIANYQQLQTQIDATIEKKKAELKLKAFEEQYTQAIKDRATAAKRLTEMELQIKDAIQERSFQAAKQAIELSKTYEEEERRAGEYTTTIKGYEADLAAFTEGRYNDMSNSAWNWVDNLSKAELADEATLQKAIRETETSLAINKRLYEKYGDDVYRKEMENDQKRLQTLQNSMGSYNRVTSSSLATTQNTWSKTLNSISNVVWSQGGNMTNAGANLVNSFANGENRASGNALSVIRNVANNISSIAGSQYGAMYTNGQNLMYGLGNGLASRGFAVVSNVFNQFMSDFKWMFGIHSPSTVFRDQIGVMLARGLGIGFENEMVPVSEAMAEAIPRALPAPAITMANIPVSSASAVASRGYSLSDVYANEAEVVQGGVSIGKQEFIINDSFDAREAGRQFMQEVRRLA